MNRLLLIALFLGIRVTGIAQTGKDTVVYNLPMTNGKLVYAGDVNMNGRSRSAFDSAANNWLNNYFISHQQCTPTDSARSSVLSQGLMEISMKPGLISIPFYCKLTIQVICKDHSYSYRIYDIRFRPKSSGLSALGYERNPEELIDLYKQKHIGLIRSMSIDRKMIRNYLSNMNTAILACIDSLNKAMAN